MAQITQAEIDSLKKKFEQKLGKYSVVFSKNEEGKEDLQIYKGQSGEEAYWSGAIIMEKDYFIKWEFSLKNGVTIKEATFQVNDDNKDIVEKIYNLYNIWFEEIGQFIKNDTIDAVSSVSDNIENEIDEESEDLEDLNDEEEDLEGIDGLNENFKISSRRNVKNRAKDVQDSSDRMKRLAGLL
jgi:RecG-like helicase